MIRVGSHAGGDTLSLTTPAGSTLGGFLVSQDIAFDPASGEVVFAPSVAELRKLGVTTQRAQLVAVSPEAERVIGNYTFNHSPYR
jgi:hypothetical protein